MLQQALHERVVVPSYIHLNRRQVTLLKSLPSNSSPSPPAAQDTRERWRYHLQISQDSCTHCNSDQRQCCIAHIVTRRLLVSAYSDSAPHRLQHIASRSVCCHCKLHAVDVSQALTFSSIGHREASVTPHGHVLQDVLETHNRRLQISDDAVTPRHRRAGRVLRTKYILHRSINGHGMSTTDFQSYPELVSCDVEVNYLGWKQS